MEGTVVTEIWVIRIIFQAGYVLDIHNIMIVLFISMNQFKLSLSMNPFKNMIQ